MLAVCSPDSSRLTCAVSRSQVRSSSSYAYAIYNMFEINSINNAQNIMKEGNLQLFIYYRKGSRTPSLVAIVWRRKLFFVGPLTGESPGLPNGEVVDLTNSGTSLVLGMSCWSCAGRTAPLHTYLPSPSSCELALS